MCVLESFHADDGGKHTWTCIKYILRSFFSEISLQNEFFCLSNQKWEIFANNAMLFNLYKNSVKID